MIHVSGIEIPILTLLFLGFSVGMLSGFTGVGGGFIITPALIMIGVPANLVAGTSLCWVFLNSVISSVIHRNLGHADAKLAIYMAIPSLFGVETGVWLAALIRRSGAQDMVILSISILLMFFIGTYTLAESVQRKLFLDRSQDASVDGFHRPNILACKLQGINLPPMVRFAKANIRISFWVLLLLGFVIGTLTGLIGIGGGFIVMPALMYILGVPSLLAVGTSTIQVMLSSFYGGARYLLDGNVLIFVALIILSASIPGVFLGTSATKMIRGVAVRLVLGITIMAVCVGAAFKLCYLISDNSIPWLQVMANGITFTGMILSTGLIVILKWGAARCRSGKPVSSFLESFLLH